MCDDAETPTVDNPTPIFYCSFCTTITIALPTADCSNSIHCRSDGAFKCTVSLIRTFPASLEMQAVTHTVPKQNRVQQPTLLVGYYMQVTSWPLTSSTTNVTITPFANLRVHQGVLCLEESAKDASTPQTAMPAAHMHLVPVRATSASPAATLSHQHIDSSPTTLSCHSPRRRQQSPCRTTRTLIIVHQHLHA